MAIENPSSVDEHALAALIYAEATVSHASDPTPEMLAVGWTARNRMLHVQTHRADRKWWGMGVNIDSIAQANGGHEFVSVSGPRFTSFRNHLASITNPGEVEFGNLSVRAARMVLTAIPPATPGVSGTNPYVWFKQGRLAPSPRATPDPVRLESHWFWSFAPGRESG